MLKEKSSLSWAEMRLQQLIEIEKQRELGYDGTLPARSAVSVGKRSKLATKVRLVIHDVNAETHAEPQRRETLMIVENTAAINALMLNYNSDNAESHRDNKDDQRSIESIEDSDDDEEDDEDEDNVCDDDDNDTDNDEDHYTDQFHEMSGKDIRRKYPQGSVPSARRTEFMQASTRAAEFGSIQRKRKSKLLSRSHDTSQSNKYVNMEDKRSKNIGDILARYPNQLLGQHPRYKSPKLYCFACEKEVNSKSTAITQHVGTSKHKNKIKAKEIAGKERGVLTTFLLGNRDYKQRIGTTEMVPQEHQTQRFKTVLYFLKAGVPLEKIAELLPTLEGGSKLCNVSSLRQTYIPTANDLFVKDLINALHPVKSIAVTGSKDQRRLNVHAGNDPNRNHHFYSLIFDGATRQGECLCVMARIVENEFVAKHLLLKLLTYSHSLSSDQLSRSLFEVERQYLLDSDLCLGVGHDSCEVNCKSVVILEATHPNLTDIPCLSHRLDLHGHRMNCDRTHQFLSIFTQSIKYVLGKQTLSKHAGALPPTECETRWWSWFEVVRWLLMNMQKVREYVADCVQNKINRKLAAKMKDMLGGDEDIRLCMELAAVYDCGLGLTQGTYFLEGNGAALITHAYDVLLVLQNKLLERKWPNFEDYISKHPEKELETFKSWVNETKDKIAEPVVLYFEETFGNVAAADGTGKLGRVVKFLKLLRMVNATMVKCSEASIISESLLEELADCWPPLKTDPKKVKDLKDQLRLYVSLAKEHAPDNKGFEEQSMVSSGGYLEGGFGFRSRVGSFDLDSGESSESKFWQLHGKKIPAWASLAKMVFVMCPSSGAVERLFSCLRDTFGDKQTHSLSDYVEASMMAQTNYPKGQPFELDDGEFDQC